MNSERHITYETKLGSAHMGKVELKELKKLGNKIRSLRKGRGFTLQDISDDAGCTKAYISQIEKGVVSPSISMLKRIATALGVRLVDLFLVPGEEDDEVVVRRGEGFKIKYPKGDASLCMLVKNLDGKNMQPLLKRLDPKSGSDGLYAHNGSQEFGYVISGEFDLMVEDKVYRLRQGDSFYFNSNRPHGFINKGEKPAEIVWVIGPPTY
jgi:transcriptional regulator with XRE-family HTH domain